MDYEIIEWKNGLPYRNGELMDYDSVVAMALKIKANNLDMSLKIDFLKNLNSSYKRRINELIKYAETLIIEF